MRTDYRYIDDSPENSLKEHRRRFFRALLALILVLRFGTCGFTLIQDGWDIWKSLYFTIITITTVGYGDYGLNPIGERFTTVLLVVGLATSTYAFGQLVQAAVSHQ
ncbi:MAG: potassium channel family protein, partial [Planctomycetota bacterium]